MVVAIIINSILIAKRMVPLWLGAAISFTSWWGATLLGLTGKLPFTFVEYVVGYVVAIFVVAGVLHLVRARVADQKT